MIFKTVDDLNPPKGEVLALSPEGVFHLTQYRPSYNIFTCQCKGESTVGWRYCEITVEEEQE